jgi:peptide/nickel transport system permease protein
VLLLLFDILKNSFSKNQNISSIVGFNLIDNIISCLFIILIPVVSLLSKKFRKILSYKLSFTSILISIIVIAFLFAPIITLQNPEFQKDISVTRLLPPLSSVKYIEVIEKSENIIKMELLKTKIHKIIPESFNTNIIFFDDYKMTDKLYYSQAGIDNEIELKSIKSENGKPIIRSKMFLLGSDEYGRDVFTRIVYGSRISLVVGFGAVLISFLLGITFAFMAAEKGGIINIIVSRVTDLFLTFPSIFLVILILALFGNNIFSIIIVLGFSGWMSLFKVAKSEIASIKTKDYYLSAKLIGLKNYNLLIKEILPVIIVPVMVNLIFQFGNVILAESALSFLGLGTGNIYPSWGAMIESGQRYISQSWWLIFIPGTVLIITLLSINELGRKINKSINPTFE